MTLTTIRPAKIMDAPQIIDMAIEAIRRAEMPMPPSKSAIGEMLRPLLSSASHFCWVGEADGRIVSTLVAMTQPGLWFDRQQCNVLLYYSRVRGGLEPLMREFARWVKSRPGIKLAVYEVEPGADRRMLLLLRRQGFARESSALSFVRGAQ